LFLQGLYICYAYNYNGMLWTIISSVWAIE